MRMKMPVLTYPGIHFGLGVFSIFKNFSIADIHICNCDYMITGPIKEAVNIPLKPVSCRDTPIVTHRFKLRHLLNPRLQKFSQVQQKDFFSWPFYKNTYFQARPPRRPIFQSSPNE